MRYRRGHLDAPWIWVCGAMFGRRVAVRREGVFVEHRSACSLAFFCPSPERESRKFSGICHSQETE